MTFTANGIEKVGVFELPACIWADGRYVGMPRTALIKWHCCQGGMFYQVYANGRYAGTTIDSQQRQMIIQLPTSLERPVRIEVFAVEPTEANTDFSNEVNSSAGPSGRVRINLLRNQNLPIGAVAQIYCDNGTGEIDYDNPLNDRPIRVWPAQQDKAGFGMSRFGIGDFGVDCAAAIGFGKGSFGNGQFGLDADKFDWVSPPLQKGVYKFAFKITDEAGNESNSETIQAAVIPAARPSEQVRIFSFDKQANQLVLNIS